MAFTSTVTRRGVEGSRKIVEGSWAAVSAATGDISTGLKKVENIFVQYTGSTYVASGAVVNETFPLQSGDVTVLVASDAEGVFKAWGK